MLSVVPLVVEPKRVDARRPFAALLAGAGSCDVTPLTGGFDADSRGLAAGADRVRFRDAVFALGAVARFFLGGILAKRGEYSRTQDARRRGVSVKHRETNFINI